MKKLVMLLGTMLLALGSALNANAASQFCIDFVNFCDGFQLAEGDGGAIVGQWIHTDCAGGHAAVTGQTTADGMQIVCSDFATCPAGFIWIFKIHAGQAGNGVFNMLGYDGTNTFPQQIGQPFARNDGACGFNGDKPAIPSMAARN